jgi:CheY-like chemotaxis protein
MMSSEVKLSHILIVDDEILVTQTYEDFLEGLDLLYTVTNSSQEAWKLIEKNEYDLIITDLDMPYLNGEELLEIIQKNANHKNVPIIIASGTSNKIHELEVQKHTKISLIKKPFSRDVFLDSIQNYIPFKNVDVA